MSKNLKMWLGIIAISLSSAVIGGVFTGVYIKYRIGQLIEQGPKGVRVVAMRVLRRKLKLSDEQARQIRPSVRRAQRKFIELRRKHRPEIEAIINEASSEIRPKLAAHQLEEFNRLEKKLMERFSQKVD